MSRIGRIIVRLFVILFGYGMAALTASVFLHFVALPTLGLQEAPWELSGGLFFSIPLVALVTARLAFMPAAALVLAAECFGIRNWLYYVFSGAAAAFGAVAIFGLGVDAMRTGIDPDRVATAEPLVTMPQVVLGAMAAGMVGAFAYWLVAGRGAGAWRKSDRLDAAS